MKKIRFAISALMISLAIQSYSGIRLPQVFSDNMVLQRDMKIPVWGWADKGEKITVSIGSQKISTKADKLGHWKLFLNPLTSQGPYEMKIQGKNLIVFKNILAGDVWVCSGQSNMEWPLHMAKNGDEEVKNADYPDIRLFTVPKKVSQFPLEDTESSSWMVCTPESSAPFSAVGYFFGRALHNDLKVPIGIINTSWGGTIAETWISSGSISQDPDFKEMLARLNSVDMSKEQDRMRIEYEKWQKEFQTKDAGFKNGEYTWASVTNNYSDWKKIELPGLWEERGLTGLDGVVWFIRKVNLPENSHPAAITLCLGPIDDSDITWINGHKVGEMYNQYNAQRKYSVDPSFLKAGENVVAVRVEDYGGGGGLYGAVNELFIQLDNEKIPLTGEWLYKIGLDNLSGKPESPELGPNSYPTLLFNGMINPILPYAIKGAIWYQGESNASRAEQYRRVFPEMIIDWRQHWGQGDFPFLFVQLANFMKAPVLPAESEWAELREAQSMTLLLPGTGMASAIDIGEANDIHPRNKQEVGRRLELAALKIAYHQDLVYSGPTYASIKSEGNKAFITFNNTGTGLEVKDLYGYIKGFSIAGPDRKFYWAKAELVNNNTVMIYADKVANPAAVRYGWADNPSDLNLYNKEGLPANPFRTDDWPD